jgi:hypothetical protein
MATATREWITVPYGPGHRREMGELAGVADPANQDWNALRWYGTVPVNGYGYNGIYLEKFKLPDGRIMIQRTDKYLPFSKFMLFADAADFTDWAKAHNAAYPEIDPETGRPFRR